jgi:YbbR domain-containing protein
VEGEAKVNEIFKKDITIKIISLLIAIGSWIYVYNIDVNPYTSTSVTVPIKSVNESVLIDKDIKLDSKLPDSILVKVTGRKQALDGLKESDLKAVVDYAKIKSIKDTTLPVDVICNKNNITIDNQSNGYFVDVSLLKLKSNTFTIQVMTQNMTFKPGYQQIKMTVTPDTFRLDGEEAVIESVDTVTATLDLKNVDRDVTKKVDCKIFNKDGKDITKYFDKVYYAEVKIEVAKEVPVNLVLKGAPAKDYVEGLKSVNPKTVLITGAPEVLAKINEIKTEPVNIENVKDNLAITGLLQLPDGVKLAGSVNEVAVSVFIDHLETRNYSVLISDVYLENKDINSGLEYSINTDNISIALKGLKKDLDILGTENMNLSVDVQGLGEGTHRLPLNIELPSSIKLLEKIYVDVEIKKPDVTASATSAD